MARPLLFETPQDLKDAIKAFFDNLKRPPTVEGLALALNTSRQTLLNYSDRPDFADIIEDAKLQIADSVMGRAMAGEINPTIAIWISKNHYGYSDDQNLNLGGQKDNPVEANLTVTFVSPK